MSDVEALVVLEVAQIGEALATLVAHELLLPGVDLLVSLQAVALVKAAAACLAAVGLLSRVDSLVTVQVASVAETLPTRVTGERFLSCVDHLVCFEAALLGEHASTNVAGERLLSTVSFQVDLEVTGRFESFTAEPTAVRSVYRMLLLVRAQVGDGAHLLAAQHTCTGNSGSVRLKVFPERIHAGCCSTTGHTGEGTAP